jgi:hypothetical protein
MKQSVFAAAIVTFLLIGLSSFIKLAKIQKCYINFPGSNDYVLGETKRTTNSANSWIEFPTSKGKTKVYLKDSYKLTYVDSSSNPFAELTLELTDIKTFKALWLDRCKLHSEHHKKDGHDPIAYININKNGYDLFGTSSDVIDQRPLLSIFYLFINEKFLITFRFLNSDLSTRTFQTPEEFETKRDAFIEAYTKHISSCSK